MEDARLLMFRGLRRFDALSIKIVLMGTLDGIMRDQVKHFERAACTFFVINIASPTTTFS